MASIFDLMPASLWPVQPLISPFDPAQPAMWPSGASGWAPPSSSPPSGWPAISADAPLDADASASDWDRAMRQALAAQRDATSDPGAGDMARYEQMVADAKRAHDFVRWVLGPLSAPQAQPVGDGVLRGGGQPGAAVPGNVVATSAAAPPSVVPASGTDDATAPPPGPTDQQPDLSAVYGNPNIERQGEPIRKTAATRPPPPTANYFNQFDQGKAASVHPEDESVYQANARADLARMAAHGFNHDYQTRILNGATFNWLPTILGAVDAIPEAIRHGVSFGEGYNYAKARADMELDQARQKTGALGTAAELGGGMLSGTAASRAVGILGRLGPNAGLGARSVAAAADGGLFGTVAGAGEGNTLVERGQNAVKGGTIGALLGVASPTAIKLASTVVGPVISNIAARGGIPRAPVAPAPRALPEPPTGPGGAAGAGPPHVDPATVPLVPADPPDLANAALARRDRAATAQGLSFQEKNNSILYDLAWKKLHELDPDNPLLDNPPTGVPTIADQKILNDETWRIREKRGGWEPEENHWFVQELRSWFEQQGINIDDFTTYMSFKEHRAKDTGVHATPFLLNRRWRNFRNVNPFATADEMHEQLHNILESWLEQ